MGVEVFRCGGALPREDIEANGDILEALGLEPLQHRAVRRVVGRALEDVVARPELETLQLIGFELQPDRVSS